MKQLVILLFTLCLLISACAPAVTPTPAPAATSAPTVAANTPKTPLALQPTPGKDVLFQVVKPDGTEVGFTWDDLKKLPLANLTVEGKIEEGPKLIDVLKAAGVTDFSEVSLSGSASPVTLTRAQVDDNTLLDFNNHGTVKLASTYVPKPQWTKDVAKIEVK
jgi:hypothetical protein